MLQTLLDGALVLRACRSLARRWREMREGRDAWKRAARFIAKRARQQRARADAAEKRVAELTAAVDQALVEHSRLEAERARLSRAVETAEAARDSALEMAADAFRHRDSAQADRDSARAQLATAESDRTRLYQCASEQGEADAGNGLVIVRKADLTALRSRQTGVDAATVRLLHALLDRLLFVDGRGGVA